MFFFKNAVIGIILTANPWMKCYIWTYWITFKENPCPTLLFLNPDCLAFFILHPVADGCHIYSSSLLGCSLHHTPQSSPLALCAFCKASAQIIAPLLASHRTSGHSPAPCNTSCRMTHCITTSESAFQFISWESSISLTRMSFCVSVGFFFLSFSSMRHPRSYPVLSH